MQKHAILVVGTGRCGTSAMTGVLQILGVRLGDGLTGGDPFNPKGYFESSRLLELNRALLATAGITLYVTPVSHIQSLPVTEEDHQTVRAAVQGIFEEETVIAIKDPRLCALLDLYLSALTELQYEVHCVVMSRAPQEVALSMERATGVKASTYLPMVHHYTELLEEALVRTAVPCIRCTFTELLTEPRSTIARIVEHLPFLSCSEDQLQQILGFVDKSLRRHDVSKSE
jgi:hypothetical protein